MIIFNIIQPPLDLFIFSNISVKTGKTRAKLACTPIQCGFLHLNKPTLRFIIENKEWSGLSWSILKGQSEWITISSPFVFMFCFFFFVAFNEWKCGGGGISHLLSRHLKYRVQSSIQMQCQWRLFVQHVNCTWWCHLPSWSSQPCKNNH